MTEQESAHRSNRAPESAERKLISDVRIGDEVVSIVHFSGSPARVFEVNGSDKRPSVEVFLVHEDGTPGLAGGTVYFDQIDKVNAGDDHAFSQTMKLLDILTNGATQSETSQ